MQGHGGHEVPQKGVGLLLRQGMGFSELLELEDGFQPDDGRGDGL
jgi:hypothetical protein